MSVSSIVAYALIHNPPHTFVPFAVEEGGRLGNEAMNFLKRASQHIQPTPGSSRDPPGLTHWLRSLALANAHDASPTAS